MHAFYCQNIIWPENAGERERKRERERERVRERGRNRESDKYIEKD